MSVQVLAGGRYHVDRVLGHGGMALVLLAQDAELDRPVAIKLLAENLSSDDTFRTRFLREARVAARLAHPNVVQVFDVGEEDGRPYIVMEYVEGETLAEELARSGKLQAAEVVDVGVQACAGLQHAHESGLVHRDVKPGNLLRRRDRTVKIADFGIARPTAATRLTEAGTVLGTAAYLAPEQAMGEEVTAAADLYSLGAVLYELLTGRTPYVFDSLPEFAVKQREHAIKPVRELEPGVPPDLEEAVMRCLARNPEFRPRSAAELARDLAAARGEPPTAPTARVTPARADEARTVRIAPAPARPDRRLPARLPLAVAGLLALLALALVLALAVARGDEGGEADSPSPSPTVALVPPAETPAQRARNLAEWLRENSR